MGHIFYRLLHPACVSARNRCAAVCLVALCGAVLGWGQIPSHTMTARRFLAGRTGVWGRSAAALNAAKQRHAAMLANPETVSVSANWQAVGPGQIASQSYGNVTGRVTAVAIDPADSTGNTVYLGTTGGGVWKSTNAAGMAANVTFTPLTDTLAVFSAGDGGSTTASLSIGAVSVANGVVLAGTGDPNDALDSYYGSGLLRSADGGSTWTLVQQSNDGANGVHLWTGLGFAGFAWSGVTATTVVAAVSDAAQGELVGAVNATYSTKGLYYSNDAGVTWQMATIKDGTQVVQSPELNGANQGGNAATAVAWNPVRQRFYAAVRYHGYYESVDGSVWTRLAAQPGAGLTAAACPPDRNTTGSTSCPIFRGALAVEPASGDMYAFTVDVNNLDQGIWRDVCGANAGVCASSTVAFGAQLDSTPLEAGFGSTEVFQGDYDLSLTAVASGTETVVLAGTVDLYRCALTTASAGSGGCGFRNTTNVFDGCQAPAMVAPAQHAIAVLASGGPLVYLGNDGGVWRSVDGLAETGTPCSAGDAGHFQNLNGGLGSLAEVVSFAQDPTAAGTLIVGVGANGTAATTTAGQGTLWPQLAAGEGGDTAIDQVNPGNWYVSTGPGVSIDYCGNGAQCGVADFAGLPTIAASQVDEDASVIDAPWLLDPGNTANVVIGTCRVWRGPGDNGAAWTSGNAISAEFGGTGEASCSPGNSFIRSLAAGGAVGSAASGASKAANQGSKVIYAGMAGVLDGGGSLGGHIFSTTTADTATDTTVWTDLAMNPVTNDAADAGVFNPGGYDISAIAVDPHDATGGTIYATVMGFAGGGGNAVQVYRSVDSGAHWTNIGSNLPNAPANGIVVDPNDAETVYVAMDTGVYATTAVSSCAAGDCWAILGAGLPNAPVIELEAGAGIPDGAGNTGELRAATYGRGIWQIPLLSAAASETAAVSLTPSALSFAAEAVGSVSVAQTVTVANTGQAALVVSSVAVTGDFAETSDCAGASLEAGESCSAQVTFAATAVGTRAGTLTVVYARAGSSAAAGQVTAPLSGTGEAPAAVSLNPLALNFGSVVVGSTSPAQNLTVSNTGGTPATLGTPSLTGDFALASNSCGATLSAGAQCLVGTVFAPTGTGTRNGTFSIASSAGTQTASLTGVGASVATDTVSPGALNFGQQQENTTSAAQTVTLTNSGDTQLTGIAVGITGAGFAMTNGCGSALAGHSACSVTVTFTPGTLGALAGTLTVTDGLRPQAVLLSGSGYPPPQESVTPGALTFAAQAVGTTSAGQQLTVSNAGGGLLALGAVTVTGDFGEGDNCAGVMLSAGASCVVNVTFTPTASGMKTGSVTIAGAAGAGVRVALTGVGAAAAAIGLSPVSLGFGTVTLGARSGTQTITAANTGGLPGTLGAVAVTGDFQLQSDYCGVALSAGAQCTMGVIFVPTAAGSRTGMFTISGPAGILTTTLTGTGAAPATDTLSPGSLTFGPQPLQTASATQTVLITNTGDAALTGLQAAVSPASFTLANGCAATLPGHSQCMLTVGFDPASAGAIAGTLTVQDQSRAEAQTVPLTGTGVAPAQIVLTPASVNFGSVVVGTTTAVQNVTISNTGGVAATLQVPAVTGDFAMTANTCGTSLAPGVGCTVALVFSPTVTGTRSGTLSVAGSAGTQTAALTGTGLKAATDGLSPLALSFGSQQYGTTSAPQSVTLTNNGDTALIPVAATLPGGSFVLVNNCGGSLAAHASCTLAVSFSPVAGGPVSAMLTVSDPVRTQSVALTGTGVAPPLLTVTPGALSFAASGVGQASAAQAVTVSNSGGGTLTVGKISVTEDYIETDNCASGTTGAALAAEGKCTVQVVFSPVATGARPGTLTVTGTPPLVPGSTAQVATVALSGVGATGAAIVLTPTSLSFGDLTLGTTSAALNITVSNTGGSPATLGAAAATGDFAISANTCGATLAASTGCTVAITFTPKASGTRAGLFSIAASAGTQVLNQTATLSGTGTSVPTDTLGPLALNFGSQQYETASAAQTVTLTNAGDEALTLITASIASGNYTVANNCGVLLAGHASCTFTVEFIPMAGGTLTGTLTVSDALRTQTVTLTGFGVAPPLAGLSPPALNFPGTVSGQSSAVQTVTVTNTGGGSLLISNVAVTSDFTDTENCSRASLAAGASCAIQVVFSPSATGPRAGTLTLLGNMPGGQTTATLSGVGAMPAAIVLLPTSLTFGTVMIGASANPVQNITISNTGGAAATVRAATVTGDFAITANTCGTSLPPSTGCTVAIGFTPTAAGTRTGSFSITDSVGTQTATLTGIGAAGATDGLSPLMLSFAAQQVGTTSAAQLVTLTNTGNNALTLIRAQITSGDFVAVSACGNALPGGSSCAIAVSYAPKMVGIETGLMTVSDQFKSQTVSLTGTGIAPPGFSISPGSLTFAALGLGASSMAQTLTVSNIGVGAVNISGITANGDFGVPPAGNMCEAMVMPNGSCTVQVVFTPTVGGTRVGSVSFADDAPASPQVIALEGVGVDFSLAADGPVSATVSSGASATYALLLSSAVGVPGTATFVCTGIPASSICTVTPGSPALGTTTVIKVTVETGVSATGDLRGGSKAIWWAAVLLGMGWLGRRRGYRWRGLVLFAVVLLAGCGSGRVIPPPYSGPGGGGGSGVTTPSGTYAVSVAGTSAGLTRTVALTLVVQ